jgi:methylamine dehydrogenase light chain
VDQLDRLAEKMLRGFASRTSRRNVFSILGGLLAGAAALPLLPVAKGGEAEGADPSDPNSGAEAAQVLRQSAGSGRSHQVRLLALLRDRRIAVLVLRRHRHLVSARYGDVAHHLDRHLPQSRGSAQLHHLVQRLLRRSRWGRCACQNNQGDRPIVRPQTNNEVTWCFGTKSQSYTCTVALILGVALDQKK